VFVDEELPIVCLVIAMQAAMATIIATILLCVMAPVVSAEVSLPLPDVQSSAEDADLLTLQFEFLNLKARVKAQKSVLTQQDTQLAELLAMPLAQGRKMQAAALLSKETYDSNSELPRSLGLAMDASLRRLGHDHACRLFHA
jgi:hypothetical protein